jgi:small-conductance mechanosensitive channel
MEMIRITYTLTTEDFEAAYRARREAEPAQRWSMRVLYALVFLLVVAGAAMYSVAPTRATLMKVVPLWVFAAVWVVIVRVVPARVASGVFREQSAKQVEQTTEFSDSGIRTESADGMESAIGWSQVLKWSENDAVFLLYLTPKLFVVYPKRVMGERVAELRGLLKGRVRGVRASKSPH